MATPGNKHKRKSRKVGAIRTPSAEFADIESLVRSYRDKEEWEALADLILRQAKPLLREGREQELESYLLMLPAHHLQNLPWALYWLGMSRLEQSPTQSLVHFETAFGMFKEENEFAGVLLSWAGAVDSHIKTGMIAPLDSWISRMEALEEEKFKYPSSECERRVASSLFRALFYRQPERDDIGAQAERLLIHTQHCPDISLQLEMAQLLVDYYLWFGYPAKAQILVDSLQSKVSSARQAPHARIRWHVMEAFYLWATASLETGLHSVTKGIDLAVDTGIHRWDFELNRLGALINLSLGDPAAAQAYLARLSSMVHEQPRLMAAEYRNLAAWQALLISNYPFAREQAESAVRLFSDAGAPFFQAMAAIGLAQAEFALGESRQASKVLSQVLHTAHKTGSPHLRCLCNIMQAYSDQKAGKESRACMMLAQAFALGKRYGYTNLYWWQPELMAGLYAKGLECDIERKYAQGVVRSRELTLDPPPLEIEHWPWPVKVYTLGRFALLKNGQPIQFSRKAQRRPLDMLKILVAFGGREVSEDRLASVLWPDAEGDAAHAAFDTTLHRLRRLIGNDKAVVLQDGRLTLNRRLCWVDTWAFERLLGEIESLLQGEPHKISMEEQERLSVKVLELYQGHFLGKESPQPWSISLHERLRSKFLRHLTDMAYYWEQFGRWDKAILCCQKGLDVDDLAELFYQRLMICHRQQGQRSEALAVYRRCRTTLSLVLQIEPSPQTEAIRKSLMNV